MHCDSSIPVLVNVIVIIDHETSKDDDVESFVNGLYRVGAGIRYYFERLRNAHSTGKMKVLIKTSEFHPLAVMRIVLDKSYGYPEYARNYLKIQGGGEFIIKTKLETDKPLSFPRAMVDIEYNQKTSDMNAFRCSLNGDQNVSMRGLKTIKITYPPGVFPTDSGGSFNMFENLPDLQFIVLCGTQHIPFNVLDRRFYPVPYVQVQPNTMRMLSIDTLSLSNDSMMMTYFMNAGSTRLGFRLHVFNTIRVDITQFGMKYEETMRKMSAALTAIDAIFGQDLTFHINAMLGSVIQVPDLRAALSYLLSANRKLAEKVRKLRIDLSIDCVRESESDRAYYIDIVNIVAKFLPSIDTLYIQQKYRDISCPNSGVDIGDHFKCIDEDELREVSANPCLRRIDVESVNDTYGYRTRMFVGLPKSVVW
jgi:hypothetical protein